MKSLLAIATAVALVGCAADEPLMRQTESGLAEAIFRDAAPEDVRSKLVGACASRGARIEEASSNIVVCSKQMEGGNAVLAQTLIGNSYSSTPVRKLQFTYYQLGSSVSVVAQQWIETRMPTGQVNRIEIVSNGARNDIQRLLTQAGAY